MAIATRKTDNLIHHSDQGIQYTCREYINILKAYHIKISMSVKGNPYDNAFVESFFKTLKQEGVYNKKRLHSSLGYRPPDEYERLLVKNGSQECTVS